MSLFESEIVVAVVRINGMFHWYRSDRELWVLDREKRREMFVAAGFAAVNRDASARFGIPVVNELTMARFLKEMEVFQVSKATLQNELVSRFDDAHSWWDVSDLFPILFVDCDRRHVAAFYPEGTKMERFVPDGWVGRFEDFATEFDDERFPSNEKFWVKGGVDLLSILNKRGANVKTK